MVQQPDTIMALFRRVDLFAELSNQELIKLVEVAVPRQYAATTRVFCEGDRGDVCYMVRSGKARVTRQHRGGREITLANLGPGDLFGELSMLDGEIRSATIEAVTNLRTVALTAPDMLRVLAEHPEVSTKLLKAVVRRLRQANERIASQSFQTVAGRVAKSLLQLEGEASPRSTAGAISLPTTIYITQSQIAQLASTSRESVSRFIADLKRAGIVSCGRGRITIQDPKALAGYIY